MGNPDTGNPSPPRNKRLTLWKVGIMPGAYLYLGVHVEELDKLFL